MRPRGGKRWRWRWMCVVASLVSCADHTEEDAKACAGYACTAGRCQAGPSGPECVCDAVSQALGAQCLLVTSDLGTDDHDSSAHPLMLDTEVVGRLDSTGNVTDVDVFRFDANPHRVYLLEVDAGPRVVVDMADSSGAVRTSASGHQLRLATPAPGGPEYIHIRSDTPTDRGEYALRVTDLAPEDTTQVLGPASSSVSRTIAPAAELDEIDVLVDPGVIYDLDCAFESPLTGNGQYLHWNTPVRFEAGNTGAPLLVYGFGVGRYRCQLTPTDVKDDAGGTVETALGVPGPPVQIDGRRDFVDDLDVFKTQAHRGKYLWAHVVPTECRVDFLPAEGQTLPFSTGGHWAHPGLLEDGPAYALVSCPQEVDRFQLTIDEFVDAEGDDQNSATPVVLGQIAGRLEGPQDVDVFVFAAKAHAVYAAHDQSGCHWWSISGATSGPAYVDGAAIVFSADGDGPIYLARTWHDGCGPPEPSSYSDLLEELGNFDVEPGDPANATPASLGVLLSGAWQYYGDLDCFAFDLTERPALAEFDAGVLRIFYSNGTVGWLYGPGWFDTLGGGRIVLCMDLPNDGGLRGLTTYPYTLRVTSP